jgi:ribosome-associated protein YbcJ (S4-like RNA binding protein)
MDQCYEPLVALQPDTAIATGAVEALGMIHTLFLQVAGAKLARQKESVTRLKETHVEQALKQVGFGDLGGQAKVLLGNKTTNVSIKKTKPTKRKREAVTTEMQAEQECLLAASKQNIMDHQQK